MKKRRLSLAYLDRRQLKELRLRLKSLSKELETAKIVFRNLLKLKIEERKSVYLRIYNLEKKGKSHWPKHDKRISEIPEIAPPLRINGLTQEQELQALRQRFVGFLDS